MWIELLQNEHTKYQKHLGGERQDELFVGTTNRERVGYIAIIFRDDQNFRRINQYFFNDDRPSGFNLGIMSGEEWPSNRPPMNPEYKSHFSELGQQVPSLRRSLEACVELLLQSGPEYVPNHDGMISLRLRERV